jgi:prolyl-tRNA synthetase
MVVLTHPDGTREPLAIGVPGDREIDQKRLEGLLEPTLVEPMDTEEFEQHPALVKGYIGPGVLGRDNESKIRYLVDPRVANGTRWVTGANAEGSHVLDLVVGRDFVPDGVIEAAEVRGGDGCPSCAKGVLETARGIEMGHIFQLGTKYAEALDLKVLDEDGQLVTVTMGSYGVGISRAVAAVAENTHDDLGLCWPREIAPADVHVVAAGKADQIYAVASAVAEELSMRGLTVIYDDRRGKATPGVKLKDADLIGVPLIVVVGKGLEEGTIEVKNRVTRKWKVCTASTVIDFVVRAASGASRSGS